MYSSVLNTKPGSKGFFLGFTDVQFLFIMLVISGALYYCLTESTSVLLVAIAIPLCLYDRAYIFPMLLTVSLCQGALQEAQVTGSSTTQDASYAETLIIAALSPILFYDLTRQRSRIIPFRFVIFYVIFFYFVYQGLFVYYQHPQNYLRLEIPSARYAAVLHSVVKSIKIIFYLFFLRVLINYPADKNIRMLELTRRFVPFILIVLAINLLVNGRSQSGAGYTGTIQMGDAHHGSFTAQLCAMSIYCFITFFKPKVSIITRGFALVAITAVGVSIMLMGSRNGLLSLALVCGIGFFIHLKNKSLGFQFIMVVLAIIAATIAIILSLNSPTVQRAIYMTETRGGGDRVYYWKAGAKALSENPVFGMGGDESASQGVVAAFAPPGVQDKVMHNTYMEMAVEYGIFGGIFYIVLVVFALTWGYRLYRYAFAKKELVIAAPAISYLTLMVAAIFISDIWDTAIWYNLSMVLALAIQLVFEQYINKRKVNTRLTYAESMVM